MAALPKNVHKATLRPVVLCVNGSKPKDIRVNLLWELKFNDEKLKYHLFPHPYASTNKDLCHKTQDETIWWVAEDEAFSADDVRTYNIEGCDYSVLWSSTTSRLVAISKVTDSDSYMESMEEELIAYDVLEAGLGSAFTKEGKEFIEEMNFMRMKKSIEEVTDKIINFLVPTVSIGIDTREAIHDTHTERVVTYSKGKNTLVVHSVTQNEEEGTARITPLPINDYPDSVARCVDKVTQVELSLYTNVINNSEVPEAVLAKIWPSGYIELDKKYPYDILPKETPMSATKLGSDASSYKWIYNAFYLCGETKTVKDDTTRIRVSLLARNNLLKDFDTLCIEEWEKKEGNTYWKLVAHIAGDVTLAYKNIWYDQSMRDKCLDCVNIVFASTGQRWDRSIALQGAFYPTTVMKMDPPEKAQIMATTLANTK